jgi:hypothetical protein
MDWIGYLTNPRSIVKYGAGGAAAGAAVAGLGRLLGGDMSLAQGAYAGFISGLPALVLSFRNYRNMQNQYFSTLMNPVRTASFCTLKSAALFTLGALIVNSLTGEQLQPGFAALVGGIEGLGAAAFGRQMGLRQVRAGLYPADPSLDTPEAEYVRGLIARYNASHSTQLPS